MAGKSTGSALDDARQGARSPLNLLPLQNQFYGERSGTVRDPFHEWLLGCHLEDLTPQEMQRRYTAMFAKT